MRETDHFRVYPEAEFMNHTILLRFQGIILRVLRLEISVWISLTMGNGVWFSIRFSSFLLYREIARGCVSLRK
jgi:hypothetical protein